MIGVAKLTVLVNNQNKDRNYSAPDAAYEKACKDLQSGEWEIEVAGVEMIVTLARKAPEVKYYSIFHNDVLEYF